MLGLEAPAILIVSTCTQVIADIRNLLPFVDYDYSIVWIYHIHSSTNGHLGFRDFTNMSIHRQILCVQFFNFLEFIPRCLITALPRDPHTYGARVLTPLHVDLFTLIFSGYFLLLCYCFVIFLPGRGI